VAPFLLPTIVPKLRQTFPQLKLLLTEDITQRLHAKLLDGELDLVLLALPYAMSNVEIHSLFKDPFYLACRSDSQHLDPQHYQFDQLATESILLLEDGHCLRDHTLAACHLQDLDKINRFNATSILTLVQMIDADLGISFLPQMVKGSPLLAGTEVKLWPTDEKSFREVGLAWRRGSARAEEFKQLGQFIQTAHQDSLS
jgi:LysR family hydrogen peroxide-inducible transcriptional activator